MTSELALPTRPDQAVLTEPPSRFGLVTLVTAPVLMLAATLVQVPPPTHDTAAELSSIAGHVGRYELSAALGFLSLLLYLPALSTLATGARRARPRLVAVGLALSVTGVMALTSLMGSGPMSQALATDTDRAVAVRITDAYESLPLPTAWMVLMLLGFVLGPLLLGLALGRAGHTWWVLGLLVAGVVVQMADAGRWAMALGYLLTAAGFAVAAVSLSRSRRTRSA